MRSSQSSIMKTRRTCCNAGVESGQHRGKLTDACLPPAPARPPLSCACPPKCAAVLHTLRKRGSSPICDEPVRRAGGRKSQSERGNALPSCTRFAKGDRAPFAIVAPSACMSRHPSPRAVHRPSTVCGVGVVSDKLVCRCCRLWWCPWAGRTFYFVEG